MTATGEFPEKVKWPRVVFAVGTPGYPDEGVSLFRDGLPRGLENDPDHEIRRYVPESASLVQELVEALQTIHGETQEVAHEIEDPLSACETIRLTAEKALRKAQSSLKGEEGR